jgi:hypothetical protein
MSFRKSGILRRAAVAVAAVATFGAGLTVAAAPATAAPAAAAEADGAAAITITRPWRLSWLTGKAAGLYTVDQPPFGVIRTYSISGIVTSTTEGTCYFVRATGDGILPFKDSPASCGPTRPAAFAIKVIKVLNTGVANIRLCRSSGLPPVCGPAVPLDGFIILP